MLSTAARRMLSDNVRAATAVISGGGEFLARRMLDAIGFHGSIMSLSEILGPEVSRCAPAYAVAVLASGQHATASADGSPRPR